MKKVISSIIAVVFVTLAVSFVGCQKEETIEPDMPYLDINLESTNLSESDVKILGLAKERIEKYVSSNNGIFEINVKSGKQINISEELLGYFKKSIGQANQLIRENSYVISGNRLIKRQQLTPRLKSGSENGAPYYSSGVYFTWYGADIYVASSAVSNFRAGLLTGALFLREIQTGNPTADALLKSTAIVSAITGYFSDSYDRGYGFTIECYLYIPTRIVTY